MDKKLANISVDFEGLYHFFRTFGLPPRGSNNVIYEKVTDRFIQLFDELDIKATFFIIGEDILEDNNKKIVKKLSEQGHEIANHSMNHEFGFRKLSKPDKEKEIKMAHEIIREVVGLSPVGFRAPCHDIDSESMDILEDLGYKYDSSIFPSYYNPLQNMIYYFTCNKRDLGMGDWRCGFAPTLPYQPGRIIWNRGERSILEMPVTVVPRIRFPFYSTVLFTLGLGSFRLFYNLVRKEKALIYCLHSIDLIDYKLDKVHHDLYKHPAVKIEFVKKYKMLETIIRWIKRDYEIVVMKEMAERTE